MNKTIRQKLYELSFRLVEATNAAEDMRLMYSEDWDGSNFLNTVNEISCEMAKLVEDMMEHDKE